MTIYTPGCEDAFGKTVFAVTSHVVHHLFAAIFHDCFAYASCQFVKDFIPTHLRPLTFATFSHTFEWMENAVGVSDLIQRCRALGTIAPARTWMLRVTFKLLHFSSRF